jgi:hypothetical protein
MRLRGSLSGRTKHHLWFTSLSSLSALSLPEKSYAEFLPWIASGLVALLFALEFPHLLWLMTVLGLWAIRVSPLLTHHPLFGALGGWRAIGVVAGVLLFVGISAGADPALAIFDKAEEQATSIFGEYVDSKIITFLFGLLRIVVWITAVGFILFAVYQAQRGEQWQPLMQNAFIVIAAVVVVEGLSAMFFE